jgi:glycosyltransferase involved in cell wall biosynthesis
VDRCIPVSVVIPAYNAGQFIEETISSVKSQSMSVQEIIVVDDGSNDDTVSVARKSGARVIEQRNLGVSVARNNGIEHARSPWIALLDADDIWQADKLERQWVALNEAPDASFSFSDFSQFDENGIRNQSVLREVHTQFASVRRKPVGNGAFVLDGATLRTALLVQNVIQPSALLVRRQALLDLNGFDKNLLACQDYDFVLRLTRDHVGVYIDKPLVRYRRHAKATTSNIPKSREGLAGVALRAAACPAEYSPEAAKYFADRLPAFFLKCGVAHLRYGDPQRSREWLKRSLTIRRSAVTLGMYALTYFVETRMGRSLRDTLLSMSSQ